ncbi:MAG: saccharopine dehydrogenase family protein [Lentisphaerae bacterium]|nr:saccharopine dehydrogenase family protein [Lentisphaerota bacterium]
MSKVLIIGAGGVGSVVAHKCAQVPKVFDHICLASRTVSKCDAIAASIRNRTGVEIRTDSVDADDLGQMTELIRSDKFDLVINVALPYQDLHIMDACLEAGVNYLDTANYEPPDEAKFCYKWQWDYRERFQKRGIMALLGCGFDPGVTNVFCAYAQKKHFDEIHTVDIMDCNGGDHGHPFATNFNPEINIREITQRGKYWESGKWKETDPLTVHQTFNFPEVGPREMYLMYHEEMESLVEHLRGLKRIRFWMTFGQEYLTHLRVLQNVGMTRIDPVIYEGKEIVPLKFLKSVLPDPSSLGVGYKGKTCIGCLINGEKDGKPMSYYIYNVCDHAACFAEVGSQAISYTTGVPAMIGAMLMATGKWHGAGVFNMEQMDPDPFMENLNLYGLPWQEQFNVKQLPS